VGNNHTYDIIIIGSGFGGSVAALRLTEKGYRVLLLEQGDRFSSEDFPETNWNLRKYLWMPRLGWRGFFKIDKFRHLAVLSGTGLGGGSLVYAGTLAMPEGPFFREGSWAKLADWQKELQPFYALANEMLGGSKNPNPCDADLLLRALENEENSDFRWQPVNASAYFGEPEKTVPDPYFGGLGPDRTGCRFCGGCMVGCRHNAKNSLDKNYLHLAEKKGAKILTGARVEEIIPLDAEGGTGYRVVWRRGDGRTVGREDCKTVGWEDGKTGSVTAGGVVVAAGVLGTVELLLRMKTTHLPNLSEMTGKDIRTNNESLIGIVSRQAEYRFSEGLAIGSILKVGNHVHIEPVRYPEGSDFMRAISIPMKTGKYMPLRVLKVIGDWFIHPAGNIKIMLKRDLAPRTVILLVMQQKDITLEFITGKNGLKSRLNGTEKPTVYIPEAKNIADKFARLVNGKALVMAHETLLGTPTTAHIFGGAVMGRNAEEGVIDDQNRVFGYKNLFVCDGSMISSNPGVNPSLTITAIAERTMALFPSPASLSRDC
jgi:cholesterol oxidase